MREYAVALRRRGFNFAVAVTVLLMVAASAPSPFYPRFAEQLGLLPVATTLIFAVYAFTMLLALLFTGSLSDTIGRRPVVTAGSLLLAVSIVVFWQSESLGMLLAARSFQGIAAGMLLPALSAMMVDFAPPQRPKAAALWNTVGAMTGLGSGALAASIILDRVANPAGVVFGSLAAVFVLIAAVVWAVPETSQVVRGRSSYAMSRLAVPVHMRHRLLVAVPAIIAGWASNGLFLALGTSVVKNEFGVTSYAQQGAIIPVFAVAGILASVVLNRSSARTISVYGTSALGIGTALSLGALALHVFPLYLLTVAVMGSGFGTAFMGVLRTLMPHMDPTERASVMAVIYVVSYLAFGVPTIIAGLLVPVISFQGAMTVLGIAIVALSLVATVKRIRISDHVVEENVLAARKG